MLLGPFCVGAAVIAIGPAWWLVRTWFADGYDSFGFPVAILTVALFCWSAASPRRSEYGATDGAHGGDHHTVGKRRLAPFLLLLAAACVRLISERLGIDVIGASALVLDVYALAKLVDLDLRERGISAFWLAAFFLFALPLEAVCQRLIGYPLQHLSAQLACGMLSILPWDVACEGIRIRLDGVDVLVDAPCSGSRMAVMSFAAFAFVAAIRRPSRRAAAIGVALTLLAAASANAVRIASLAVGLVHPIPGIDVMASPWHDMIGLVALAGCITSILVWARRVPSAALPAREGRSVRVSPVWAWLFLVTAIGVVSTKTVPIDVSRPATVPPAPAVLAGFRGIDRAVTAVETRYYAAYGGSVARRAYGPFELLLVTTTSPLRHLHDPRLCLGASGYDVRYVGTQFDPVPSAHYRVTGGGDDARWDVLVTYVGSNGALAASVAEVVWLWLQDTDSTWTMVERVTPVDTPADEFQAGALRAFNLSRNNPRLLLNRSVEAGPRQKPLGAGLGALTTNNHSVGFLEEGSAEPSQKPAGGDLGALAQDALPAGQPQQTRQTEA